MFSFSFPSLSYITKKPPIQCFSLNIQERIWDCHRTNVRETQSVYDLIEVSNLYTFIYTGLPHLLFKSIAWKIIMEIPRKMILVILLELLLMFLKLYLKHFPCDHIFSWRLMYVSQSPASRNSTLPFLNRRPISFIIPL